MDHLTSRFRRSRRESLVAPTPPQDTSPTTTTAAATAGGGGATGAAADARPALPSLSINTTPITTPPGSSYTSHSILPKSPLRSLNQFRTAHKRGRSPPSGQANVPNIMSSLSPTPSDASPADRPKTPPRRAKKPQLPPFLKSSHADIESKFQELIWLERMRSQQFLQNPASDFRFARALSPETKALDRYANIQPWSNNRVRLPVPEGKLDYINASPIVSPSPLRPDTRPNFNYIAMQGPKVNTVEHTWRMIAQLKSPVVIVMLTDTYEGHVEKCYPYFPHDAHTDRIEVGETDEFEDGFRARIQCVSTEERQDGAIQMRKLNLHVEGRGDMTVWHLLYRKWPDFGVPKVEDYDSFFELMKLSRELNSSVSNPRIIHCSAGVGRTGTFIALETLMREVDEGAMDNLNLRENDNSNNNDLVFRTVNHLREQRRTMVQADSQYAFIYKVLRRQWLERHGLLDDVAEFERASKRLEVYHDPFVEHNG
ncbi:protein-tyrosine phosphatase-like protein [Nemania sp. FL0031]|nr:protein-tyrosine phosphatase-like protein [Nemania sp. FL0031]